MHVGLNMDNNWLLYRLSDLNFDEICRLCLSNKGIMSAIFGSKPGQHLYKLPYRIKELTTVKIEEDDGLPYQICHSCLYNLERLSEFKQQCKEADTLLKEYSNSTKEEGEGHSISELVRTELQYDSSYEKDDSNQFSDNENGGAEISEHSFEPSDLVENSLENGDVHIEGDLCEEESITQQPFSIDLWGLQNELNNDLESMVMVVDPSTQPMDDRYSDSDLENDRNNAIAALDVDENGQEYILKCTSCNKGFMNEERLQRHSFIHTQEPPFPCDFCDSEFEERNQLKKHWRSHAGIRPYICFTCGETFFEKCYLAAHQKIHDYIKPFHCETCGKAFAYKSDLRKHSVIHSGIRPYVCKVCGKSFTRSTNLNKHSRVHSGRRPFACQFCKKMFASRGDLTRHIVIHTGEKPYACTVCDLAFNRKDKLSRHEKLHAGERPFVCPECPTSFHRKEELTKHIQFHHYIPDPSYKCKIKRPSEIKGMPRSTRSANFENDVE